MVKFVCPFYSGWCAKLYQHHYSGWVVVTGQTNNGKLLGNKNDQVSSIIVRKGCILKAYRHNPGQDLMATVTSKLTWKRGDGKNDQMSGYTCRCPGKS